MPELSMPRVDIGRWYIGLRCGPFNIFIAWFNHTTWVNYGRTFTQSSGGRDA